MSFLGFCSAVWGLESPPSVIFIITKTTTCNPYTPITSHTPTPFNSPTSLISFFYLSITFPFTPLLFSHSFFFYPRLFHFTPSPTSLNIPLPTIIKHLTLGRAAPPLQPPAFAQSSLQPGYVRLSSGSGAPVTPRPSRWPPLCSDLCV